MALTISRSDLYPVGTVVQAFSGVANRHHAGKPSGTAAASATVDANGRLTFPSLAAGVYTLWAEVGGQNVNLLGGASQGFKALGTLRERIAAARKAAGVF